MAMYMIACASMSLPQAKQVVPNLSLLLAIHHLLGLTNDYSWLSKVELNNWHNKYDYWQPALSAYMHVQSKSC